MGKLHDAAKNGNLDEVNRILDNNGWLGIGRADVNSVDGEGNTALLLAAAYDHAKIVAALIERGADVNAANKSGRTALHAAAQQNREGIVGILISSGARTGVKDVNGKTALNVAESAGHSGVVRLLREADALSPDQIRAVLDSTPPAATMSAEVAIATAEELVGFLKMLNVDSPGDDFTKESLNSIRINALADMLMCMIKNPEDRSTTRLLDVMEKTKKAMQDVLELRDSADFEVLRLKTSVLQAILRIYREKFHAEAEASWGLRLPGEDAIQVVRNTLDAVQSRSSRTPEQAASDIKRLHKVMKDFPLTESWPDNEHTKEYYTYMSMVSLAACFSSAADIRLALPDSEERAKVLSEVDEQGIVSDARKRTIEDIPPGDEYDFLSLQLSVLKAIADVYATGFLESE